MLTGAVTMAIFITCSINCTNWNRKRTITLAQRTGAILEHVKTQFNLQCSLFIISALTIKQSLRKINWNYLTKSIVSLLSYDYKHYFSQLVNFQYNSIKKKQFDSPCCTWLDPMLTYFGTMSSLISSWHSHTPLHASKIMKPFKMKSREEMTLGKFPHKQPKPLPPSSQGEKRMSEGWSTAE